MQRLAHKKKQNILISRNEELNLLKPETLDMFSEKYVMDEVAGNEEETSIEISSEAAQKSKLDEEMKLVHLVTFHRFWESFIIVLCEIAFRIDNWVMKIKRR